MPLSFKIRDEENERINNLLKKLIGLDYVPENGNGLIDELLAGLDLNMQSLLELKSENLVAHLQKSNFDWENAEQFADFLIALSSRLPEKGFSLSEKAIAVYRFVQTESKTFSFNIVNKINAAQKQP